MELFGITGTEWVGYLASLAVLLSFTMKDMTKLRIVNGIGCILWVWYGLLMDELRIGLPIIITNAAILAINLYYLFIKKN